MAKKTDEKIEGQIMPFIVSTHNEEGTPFSKPRGWLPSEPGNPVYVDRTFDFEGNLISEEERNIQEEIDAAVVGTRIYDVIDRMANGYMPVQASESDFMDLTNLPETDGEAIKLGRALRASKLKEEGTKKEEDTAAEKKAEAPSVDVSPDEMRSIYEKLKTMLGEDKK